MPKEGVRDKLFIKAGLAEPLTSHVRAEEVPWQCSTRVDAFLERNVVGRHNDLGDGIFD